MIASQGSSQGGRREGGMELDIGKRNGVKEGWNIKIRKDREEKERLYLGRLAEEVCRKGKP